MHVMRKKDQGTKGDSKEGEGGKSHSNVARYDTKHSGVYKVQGMRKGYTDYLHMLANEQFCLFSILGNKFTVCRQCASAHSTVWRGELRGGGRNIPRKSLVF